MGTRRRLQLQNQGQLELFEDKANGTKKVILKAPASLAADATFELPAVDGAAGEVLVTDGAGALSFGPPTATPAAHAASHQDGGSDEIATATPGADEIPKAAATSRLDTGWLGSGSASATTLLRGDQAWVDQSEFVGRPPNYFRHVGGAPVAWYPAGCITATPHRDGVGVGYIIGDILAAIPFASMRGGTLDRIRCDILTFGGALSMIRLGIYEATSDVNLYPGALLADCGEATGLAGNISLTISQALEKNKLYWMAVIMTGGGGAVPLLDGRLLDWPVFGWPAVPAASDTGVGQVFVVQAYGALPDPFPAEAGALYQDNSVPGPAIDVRYSS